MKTQKQVEDQAGLSSLEICRFNETHHYTPEERELIHALSDVVMKEFDSLCDVAGVGTIDLVDPADFSAVQDAVLDTRVEAQKRPVPDWRSAPDPAAALLQFAASAR